MTAELGPAGRLGALFLDSKLTPLLVVAALALGALAVSQTAREEEPQIVVPIVDVFVGLPGADPAEVEDRLTVPLEKRLWEIPGVEYVYSASMPERAMVTVRFRVGDDLEDSLVAVWEKIASGLHLAASGATMPLVQLRSIDDVPVLALTLWSPERDGFELRRIAAELGREIAAVEEVSELRLIGGERRVVRVELDTEALRARSVDPLALATALSSNDVETSAGAFRDGGSEVLVSTDAFLESAEEIEDLVVGAAGGRPVRLRDVARVIDGPEEPSSSVLYGGGAAGTGFHPAVTLAIAKRKGADAHHVVGAVRERVEGLRGTLLPEDVRTAVTRDYGETANQKAGELLLHLGLAILSVSVVIGFFLGWRGALVVFVSVPVSFALTLFVYYVFGYTLNRVTLFALIFVTGIVVDDSIIVVENIVRHFHERKRSESVREAALAAVNEVGNPTILATLTVVASVLPMAFVRGLMGPYMRPMPVGASLAMAFSLLVALIAAPWFAIRLLRDANAEEETGERTRRIVRRILGPMLERPRRAWLFLGLVTAALVASIALVPLKLVAVKMLPFDDKSEMQVVLDFPEGTPLETSTRAAREVADALLPEREVVETVVYAGTSAPIDFNGLVRHYDLRSGGHVASVHVLLEPKDRRSEQSHPIAKRLRPKVVEVAERWGAAAKVVEVPPGPPVLATLVAEIYGPTFEERRRTAERVREIFETTPGVVDIDWTLEAPQHEVVLDVDRDEAMLRGIPPASIARAARLALRGEDVGVLHVAQTEPIPIRVRLPVADRSGAGELGELALASADGSPVALGELTTVRERTLPPSRWRKNLLPVVYVTGDVAGDAESPVYAILDMEERLEALELPSGGRMALHYTDEPTSTERAAMKWDGEWHITYEVFRDLGAAFGAVLLLIYLLIVGWFGSFRVPWVMMIAIPLSLVGILPGHWLFGAFFTATSMIGFIALAGIMVRNSVLLIDFVDLERAAGRSLAEAVQEAVAVRFRPILLTAGTVVVGAIVILFDPIFQGLAISLMFGALASTALTLGVVPLVYFMVERDGDRPGESE